MRGACQLRKSCGSCHRRGKRARALREECRIEKRVSHPGLDGASAAHRLHTSHRCQPVFAVSSGVSFRCRRGVSFGCRLTVLPQQRQRAVRQTQVRCASRTERFADAHDRAGVRVRQRPQQDAVDDAEHGAVRADAQREDERHGGREAGTAPQAPEGVAQVTPQVVEPASPMHRGYVPESGPSAPSGSNCPGPPSSERGLPADSSYFRSSTARATKLTSVAVPSGLRVSATPSAIRWSAAAFEKVFCSNAPSRRAAAPRESVGTKKA